MHEAVWRRLVALVIVFVGVLLIWTADRDVVRFASVGNAHVCAVRQLLDLPAELDAVFLGSSRVRRGISTTSYSDLMGVDEDGVFNLGRPGREILRSESIISYLIESGRRPDVVVMEADIDRIQLGGDDRQFWSSRQAGFLTFGEIVSASLAGNRDRGWQRVVQGMHNKMTQTLLRHLSGITFEVVRSDAGKPQNVCWNEGFDKKTKGKLKKQAKQREKVNELYEDIETSFDDRFNNEPSELRDFEIAAIERIRQRLKAVGSHLVVVRQQGYLEPPLSADVVKKVQAQIPEFAVPDESLRRKISDQYMDKSHLDPEGRATYTTWLTSVISSKRSSQ